MMEIKPIAGLKGGAQLQNMSLMLEGFGNRAVVFQR
jgi:hypothetical protein